MKRFTWLLILIFVLLAVPAWAEVDEFNTQPVANIDEVNAVAAANIDDINAVDFVSCTDACNNANITAWINEDGTINGTQNCVSGADYSAGDTSWVGAGVWNTDAVKVGTNGWDGDASNEYLVASSGVDTILNNNVFRVGFWFDWNTAENGLTFWRAYVDANSEMRIRFVSGATDDIELTYKEPTNGTQTCTTTFAGIGLSWHWVEARVDRVSGVLQMWVDNTQRCSTTGLTMADFDPNTIRWGILLGTTPDLYVDQLIISSDDNTSLWDYRDDTGYDSCN
jgi:hypothetical protein